jgi:nitrile hydratase subunit beta
MNGVHDIGGMHGFGPIVREENEPLFHAAWEGRVRAMAVLTMARGSYTIDAFRYGIERMAPAEYLRAPYFERWLATVERNLVEQGFVMREELENRTKFLRDHPEAPLPPAGPNHPQSRASNYSQSTRPGTSPRFAVGDGVVTRNVHPSGHTRLPRYARSKRGIVVRSHGPHVFPDTNAVGLGEQPQPLYTVRFDARELWGESAEGRQTVSLELWESYLEPARVESYNGAEVSW